MIGLSAARKDALDKALGRALYVDDIRPQDAWVGLTLRSPHAAGVLHSVFAEAHFPHDRAVLVTGADLGERNRVAMIVPDMPFLATERVRYLGEPIALVAAPSAALAREAAQAVLMEIEPAPALGSLEEVVRRWRERPSDVQVLAEYELHQGDVGRVLGSVPLSLEGTYTTGAQEQAYIEPQGMIAWPAPRGGILIEGSLQCPYYVHPALVQLLGCAPQDVIVRQTTTGGAFGGKEDFPSLLAGHAALLAHACGHPVKMIYDRSEDILYTTKRHPSIVHHRSGITRDGALLAMEVEVILDGGAYTTLSPVVLSRAIIHATGPYACPHVSVHGVCLATNLPPMGAFRGFGVPQVAFAIESHMDRLADLCGVRPDEIRRRNLVRLGSTTATGQVLRESVSAERVLDEAVRAADFAAQWSHARRAAPARRRRGIGLALTWHGGGFTGSGEKRLTGRAQLTIEDDGDVLIRVASVDMGQGSHTVLPQIAAARLGIPLERVTCARPDTSQVPDSGPTVASRTTMIVGSVVDDCARQLVEALQHAMERENADGAQGHPSGTPCAPFDFDAALSALRRQGGPLRFESHYVLPPWIHWDEATHRGDAYAVFSYACTTAEVEVDSATGEVHVERIVSAVDAGRAVNPVALEGQIEGATLQGVGYALLERATPRAGRFEQNRFQTYIIPTALDAPAILPILVEEPYSGGPGGAKGAGELPMNGPAPAIANAIANATGLRIPDLPILPEMLCAAGWRSLPPSGEGAAP